MLLAQIKLATVSRLEQRRDRREAEETHRGPIYSRGEQKERVVNLHIEIERTRTVIIVRIAYYITLNVRTIYPRKQMSLYYYRFCTWRNF